MNLNEFQEAWKNEEGGQPPLSLPPKNLKRAHQPIENIRNNMRNEFYFQLAGILVVGILPVFNTMNSMALIAYYSLFVFFLAISLYYFSMFYRLFKSMHHYNQSLKENLYELYYEIRLHIEMYKSFNFLLIPFIFLLTGILLHVPKANSDAASALHLEGVKLIAYVITGLVVTIIMLVITNYWVKRFYGKHATQIKRILDELKEP